MEVNVGRFGSKLFAMFTVTLLMCSLSVGPAIADTDHCVPPGVNGGIAVPGKLGTSNRQEDTHTTPDVEPLNSVDIGTLGLGTPGTLTVGTLSQAPPSPCVNSAGQ